MYNDLKLTTEFRSLLIKKLLAKRENESSKSVNRVEDCIHETGLVPLTPTQARFLNANQNGSLCVYTFQLLKLPFDLDMDKLREAYTHLVRHHDALRLGYKKVEDGWEQTIIDTINLEFSQLDFSYVSDNLFVKKILTLIDSYKVNFELSNTPLLNMLLLDCGNEKPKLLLWMIHHLLVDGFSWRILTEDLQIAYHQLRQGLPVKLFKSTTPYKDWALKLVECVQMKKFDMEKAYWLDSNRYKIKSLPKDFAVGIDTIYSETSIELALNTWETEKLFKKVQTLLEVNIDELLLTALLLGFFNWTGYDAIMIDLERFGRDEILEGINLSRTVGWFSTQVPVVLYLGNENDILKVLQLVKEQLQAVPSKGIGYGVLRYLNKDPILEEQFNKQSRAEICLNYIGRLENTANGNPDFSYLKKGKMELACNENEEEMIDNKLSFNKTEKLDYLFEFQSMVIDDKLHVKCIYSKNLYNHATVVQLMKSIIKVLRDISYVN